MIEGITERTFEDAFDLLCGDLLGRGVHRKVFACKLLPALVVKVEYDELRYFANFREQAFWDEHQDYPRVAEWLAPCEFLSPDGRVLLQRRVDPLPAGYAMPEQLPHFLPDHKRENYGLLDGRFVCVDYSMVVTSPSLRPRKVTW
jgi:hypothetical protein